MELKRDIKIREELKNEMAKIIDRFFTLHDSKPSTGFLPVDLAEHLLSCLESRNWHGVKDSN